MAERVPARLTPAELRRFGLVVGGAFLALAAVFSWRGRGVGAAVSASIGGLLVLGGLVAPAALGPVYRSWMAFALAMSKITTPILLSAIYYLVITPIGLLRRALSRNPLVHAASAEAGGGYWQRRAAGKRRSRLDRPF